MGTRAIQLDILLSGLRDPDTGAPLSGGTVEFYSAGTTTPKNVWSEKAKTNDYTSVTLDVNGSVVNPYYGDGWYKLIIKDALGATEYTWDQVYLQSNAYTVVQKTADYTVTPDDDVILCNGTFTVSLASVATFEHPVIIKSIGTGTITIDPYGSETIDGSTTVSIVNQYDAVTLFPDTTSNVWRKSGALTADLNGTELILDEDADTSITADTDDQIDFKIGGTDKFQMNATDFKVDIIAEKTSAAGVTIDGVLLKDSTVKTDTIIEKTSAAGVTIDSVTLKDGGVVLNSISQGKDVTAAIHRKIVQIGDWNMDSTDQKVVAHGLTQTKIRAVHVIILSDSSIYYPLPFFGSASSIDAWCSGISDTNVTLTRKEGGVCDDVYWDSTGFNRGWLIIEYVD